MSEEQKQQSEHRYRQYCSFKNTAIIFLTIINFILIIICLIQLQSIDFLKFKSDVCIENLIK
jgi:hypothetical protein